MIIKLFDKIHFLDRELCPWWFAYTFDNPVRRLLHKPEGVLGPYVKEGMMVVDVGCGLGHFSLGMARLVGPKGRVISVDLQQKMLDRVGRRAVKAGVNDRVSLRLCTPGDIGVAEQVDFVLTSWMMHEVPDQKRMFEQIRSMLKDDGRWLLTEPRLHVSLNSFERTVSTAVDCGFTVSTRPSLVMSYAALLKKSLK